MKKKFWPNSIFSNSKMAKNQFLKWEKSLKLPKRQFHEKKMIYLISRFFFVWTFFSGPLCFDGQNTVCWRSQKSAIINCFPYGTFENTYEKKKFASNVKHARYLKIVVIKFFFLIRNFYVWLLHIIIRV